MASPRHYKRIRLGIEWAQLMIDCTKEAIQAHRDGNIGLYQAWINIGDYWTKQAHRDKLTWRAFTRYVGNKSNY